MLNVVTPQSLTWIDHWTEKWRPFIRQHLDSGLGEGEIRWQIEELIHGQITEQGMDARQAEYFFAAADEILQRSLDAERMIARQRTFVI